MRIDVGSNVAAVVLAIIVAAAVITLRGVSYSPQVTSEQLALPGTGWQPVDEHPPARDTIIIFTDYRCPYCREVPDFLSSLRPVHDLLVVVEPFPLGGSRSHFLAAAGYCAYASGAERAADSLLYHYDGEWTHESLLPQVSAEVADLDSSAFVDCLASPTLDSLVSERRSLARSLGVRATPSMIFRGRLYTGLPEVRYVRKLLQQQR